MPTAHERDELGRLLPHPAWPAGREAPAPLELLRRFCNTTNRESGAERLTDPARLDRWLDAERLGPVGSSRLGLARVIALREAMHRLTIANRDGSTDAAADAIVARVLSPVAFKLSVADGAIAMRAVGPRPVDELLGRLALVMVDARANGTWARLKACSHCAWVVYDTSKNCSSRWCTMAACGGRHNARAYRARLRH